MNILNYDDLTGEYIIIDIRDKNDYDNFHLKNSINIEFDKLLVNPSLYLDFNHKYCFYCDRGLSSLNLSNILNKLGYNTFSLNGGIINKKNTF